MSIITECIVNPDKFVPLKYFCKIVQKKKNLGGINPPPQKTKKN